MNKIFTLVCLCVFPFVYASAEGYQVNAQSTKQAAMGHVGAAMKLGAESMHFNPAGLGFLNKQIDLSAGFTGVFSKAEFTQPDGYKHKSDNNPSTPLYFYGGFKIYDFLSAGISVTNPYGSTMDWGHNWRGSALIQDISLKSFSIQPTVAWKITDRLSIGAGMMVMFGDFSLSRALIPAGGLTKLQAASQLIPELVPVLEENADIINKYKDISAASTTLSGDANVRLGINVGAMFDITDQITIGVSYRSKVKMKVKEGHAEMKYANENELKGFLGQVNPILIKYEQDPLIVPPLDAGTFEAELPLPSNFNVGVTYKPNDRWMVSGEVQFVGWGAYKDLNVQFSQEVLNGYSINAPKEYKNTRIYRLGGQFAATKRFDVRLGVYYDETPVKTDYLNPETPSMNKLGLTTGFSFRPLENLSIDMAFSYITGFGRDGSYTDQLSGFKLEGHYDVYALMPSIGLGYQF